MSITRNPNLGPSQIRVRRRRLFLIRFLIILFFVLVIIFTLAIFSGHEKIKVKEINVYGNAAVSADDILAIVNRDLTGRYFYLFARNDFLIFPRFQIQTDILNEIKAVKEVDVSWNSWQKISITVMERRPDSVWCGPDIKVVDPQCYFVDNEGYIYSLAPVFSGSMFIKGYGNISTSTSPIGQQFLTKPVYAKLLTLAGILDQNNMKVVAMSYDGHDYRFILEQGIEIIFNDKTDFDASFDNLLRAVQTNNLDLNKDVQKIKYIDLRFADKIVVGKK